MNYYQKKIKTQLLRVALKLNVLPYGLRSGAKKRLFEAVNDRDIEIELIVLWLDSSKSPRFSYDLLDVLYHLPDSLVESENSLQRRFSNSEFGDGTLKERIRRCQNSFTSCLDVTWLTKC